MKTFLIDVTRTIEVTLDETKFTEEFMSHFREYFYPFYSVEDHAKHLAQLEAREMIGWRPDDFIEGYGAKDNFGITTKVIDQDEEVQ